MKKIIFKSISVLLIFFHLSLVCLRDISFAQEAQEAPTSSESPDYAALGKVPDTVGHGQASASGLTPPANGGSALFDYPSFFQKDTQAPNNRFNSVLESVSADLFTGKANLSIPIFMPSGKRDIAPPLRITHTSGTINGLVGVCWSLGLETISRSTKKGVPKYDSNDTFIDRDQELVGIATNEYRQKIESAFIKYTYSDNSWQATDKLGVKYFFGSADASRIITSRGTFSWALDKIMDTSGNYLSITYTKEDNQLYPANIYYTANDVAGLTAKYKITFTYEDRTDIAISYTIGERVKVAKRLKLIEVFLDTNTLLRRYNFEYSLSPSTKRSLLTKVTEYGSDGQTTSPPITFTYRSNTGSWSTDYSKWHTPDGDFIKSEKDQGRRLYDLNGDAMFDFVISRYDPNEPPGRQWLRATHLNSKDGFNPTPNWWPVPLGYFIYDTWDDGRRLVDLTGDGIPELLAATLWDPYSGEGGKYKDAYEFQYIDQQNPHWVQNTSWNLPNGYFVYGNRVDGGRRFADLNGDGLSDLSIAVDEIHWSYRPLDYVPRTTATYINTGSGWQEDTRWVSPSGYYITSSGDGGRRLMDINGDGLADFLVADGSSKATYLNTGSGWVSDNSFNIPDGSFASSGKDQGRMIVDINGDNLNDLVIAMGGYKATYLNTGSGWRRDDSYNIPDGDFVDSGGKDQGRYLADLDGDGVCDICVAKDGYKKAYLNLSGYPDLLIGISNGIGGETTIEYTPSTAYSNYYPNKTGKLPFAAQVVSKITSSDSRGSSYVSSYFYEGGYYDAADREFRGFGYAKITDPEGNYTESYFKQDDLFKGRPYKQETKNSSGALYSRSENTWASTQIYLGVNFIYLAQTDSYTYEGQATPKHTRVNFSYDSYGNPSSVILQGDVDVTGDEKTQNTEYVYSLNKWILACPKYTYLLDAHQNKISEKWLYYDNHLSVNDPPTKGLLTKQEVLAYNPLTQQSYRVATSYTYDDCGNLLTSTDPLKHVTAVTYELEARTYPRVITNALNQTIINAYDLKTGQVLTSTDPNNQVTTNVYDTLGRLVKVIGPLDSEQYPGSIYEYDLSSQPIKITKRVKADYATPPNYLTTYEFYDGLGRLIEAKTPAEDDPGSGAKRQVISGIAKYDSRGLVKEKYLPCFVSETPLFVEPDYSTPHFTFGYDCLGRLVQTINPDSTTSSTSYAIWSSTSTDENNHSKSQFFDVYGRIVKVEEYNGTQTYTTTYEYDTLGNLTKTTDNQGNSTLIWYDSLGRKLKMSDPDMGIWLYEYDASGNLTKQTDAKGQVIVFTYDSLNRLVKKHVGGLRLALILATYLYDDQQKPNSIGRLSKVTDRSGSTNFYYDILGRETKSIKTIGISSYTVQREYDALGRLTKLTYPDNSIVQYTYNPQGIETVQGLSPQSQGLSPSKLSGTLHKGTVPNTITYITNINYSATGQLTKITYGNDNETNYTYDPNNLRLTNIITQSLQGKIQDLAYQFDNVGNIRNITDYVNSATQSFLYDDLNRLTQAQGSYGSFSYTYDSIGNMLEKEGVTLTYGRAGGLPHAVTQYGSTLINYDANGNMIHKGLSPAGGLSLSYDVENRLSRTNDGQATTSYTYDGDGGRVKKTVGVNSTTYVGSLYEITSSVIRPGDTITKHIFAGANMICSIDENVPGQSPPVTTATPAIRYFHSDHLGSSNVITDSTGAQVGFTEFTPYGSTFRQTGTYDPKHKFTGKELDSSNGLYFYGARYYDPQLGRFISADTIVQSPYDPQSLNRYAYCRNNPINLVDPSGHKWSWKHFWHSFAGGFLAAAIGVITYGAGFSLMAAGFWGGMAGGALAGGLEGGWQGALIGGAIGGALGAFGGLGVDKFGWGFAAGMLVAGAGYAAGTGGWEGLGYFGGGILGSLVGTAVGAAYLSAGAPGSRRNQLASYADKEKQAQKALSVNGKDSEKVAMRVGSRKAGNGPLGTADHQFAIDVSDNVTEMGPGWEGKVKTFKYNLNDRNSIMDAVLTGKTPQSTIDAINSRQVQWSDWTSASKTSFNTLVSGYEMVWSGEPYVGGSFNSNYAVNSWIYGSGGEIKGLSTNRPSFSGSQYYQ